MRNLPTFKTLALISLTLTALIGCDSKSAGTPPTHDQPPTDPLPAVIHGHRLPPEPDPKVNNATLLGVDVNHNGVRDDVERKVYATYKKAIDRAVMMQAFRTEQKMLADPDLVKHAREWAKKEDKALNCRRYLYLYRGKKRIKKMAQTVDAWQFNTEKRVKAYLKFDRALSGGVYSLGTPTLQDCEFDVEKVLEMDK